MLIDRKIELYGWCSPFCFGLYGLVCEKFEGKNWFVRNKVIGTAYSLAKPVGFRNAINQKPARVSSRPLIANSYLCTHDHASVRVSGLGSMTGSNGNHKPGGLRAAHRRSNFITTSAEVNTCGT